MRNEAIATGRTVDAAIEAACAKLGLEREEVEIEVLDLPHKGGFLGFTNIPAKIKAFVDIPDPPAPAPAAPVRPVRPVESRPAPAPVVPAAPARPAQSRPDPAPAVPAAPARPVAPMPAGAPFAPVQNRPEQSGENAALDNKAQLAARYVNDILHAMGLDEATVSAARDEQNVLLTLDGDAAGVAIGRRGETLDALQYLTGLSANRSEGDYVRVVLDSGNYREKRQHTLEQLAKKLAASSIKTGRSTTLEPMNPYERRIIHATVSEIEGVASTSVGEEPNRCVVISSTSPRPQQAARVADDRRPVRRDEPSRGPRPAPRREFAPRPAPVPPAFELPQAERPAPVPPVFEPSQAERPAPVPPVSEPSQAERPAPMRAPEGERPAAAAEGRFPRREDSRPPRRDDRRSGGRDDRRGGRREKPEPYQVTGEREVAPTEGADTPLYGKIEL